MIVSSDTGNSILKGLDELDKNAARLADRLELEALLEQRTYVLDHIVRVIKLLKLLSKIRLNQPLTGERTITSMSSPSRYPSLTQMTDADRNASHLKANLEDSFEQPLKSSRRIVQQHRNMETVLGKRSPSRYTVHALESSGSIRLEDIKKEELDLPHRPLPTPTSKKRGRNLYSEELENHLLEKIRCEMGTAPDRLWIAKQAKLFIGKNNVNLKCSKGWLDKFMKRNRSLIVANRKK